MSVHNIVIIGASYGGLPAAHGLLKDVLPQIKKEGLSYKITMIAPSAYFYWKVGSPRTIVNPSALPIDKVLLPIKDGFKNYSAEQFEFVQAYARHIDPMAKTVETDVAGSFGYDSLLICSGTYFSADYWSTSNGADAVRKALEDIHRRLPQAKTVVVAGGGAAGVETAGELGQTYGGKKDIILYSGSDQLLNRLTNKAVGKDAEARLTKMGVKVVNGGVRVVEHINEGAKDILKLSNGETVEADVYIASTGDKPNSQFVPKEWVNEKGYVRTDGKTLRLNVPGVQNVYCFGSVGSYSDGSIFDTKFAIKPLLETIKLDLQGQRKSRFFYCIHVLEKRSADISSPVEPGPRTKNVYNKIEKDMQFVPLGSTQGVGVVMGFKIPSFMVKMAKSKDFMIGQAPKLVQGTG